MARTKTYQAITTRYFGPGNVRGSRVKATAAAGSITLDWDDALNSDDNHANAAAKLALKFGWQGAWYGGMTQAGEHVFVRGDLDTQSFVTAPDDEVKVA